MSPIEEMVEMYVQHVDGEISAEEWQAYFKGAMKLFINNPSLVAALFDDPRLQEALIRRQGEERARRLIKFAKHQPEEQVT